MGDFEAHAGLPLWDICTGKKCPDWDKGQDECCGWWLGLSWVGNTGTEGSLGGDVIIEVPPLHSHAALG